WLAAVVTNALHDFRRERQRHPDAQAAGGALDRLLAVEDRASVEELASTLETYQDPALEEVVAWGRRRVSPDTWEAVRQHHLAGRPAGEVAEDLQKSVGSVDQGVYRVKGMLLEEGRRRGLVPDAEVKTAEPREPPA